MAGNTDSGASENVWKVSRVQPENHDVNSLIIEGPTGRFGSRKAGQYAVIRLMRPDGWSEPHPFTISCAPEDPYLQFTIKKIGAFTSAIPELTPGSPVKVMGPMGTFCAGIDDMPSIVLIAGGVGVTPFLSVLRHFCRAGLSNEVKLFWSNKTIHDVFCKEEISRMTVDLNLAVIHNLSRDDDVTRYLSDARPRVFFEEGRLNADTLGRYGVTAGQAVYLCGPPPMMEAVLEELARLGIDPQAVEREKFSWK
ncbi:MAG TPA: FAD/NAD-binding family oxidoreductase [Deltaproteobacteria bacterium]|nr:FAD/NAD-binding family oxidoreductase [Deltaproteobacteria bacterium]